MGGVECVCGGGWLDGCGGCTTQSSPNLLSYVAVNELAKPTQTSPNFLSYVAVNELAKPTQTSPNFLGYVAVNELAKPTQTSPNLLGDAEILKHAGLSVGHVDHHGLASEGRGCFGEGRQDLRGG